MVRKMENIQPITKELINSLGINKYPTLRKYHIWLEKVRKQDRIEADRFYRRIMRKKRKMNPFLCNLNFGISNIINVSYYVIVTSSGEISENLCSYYKNP